MAFLPWLLPERLVQPYLGFPGYQSGDRFEDGSLLSCKLRPGQQLLLQKEDLPVYGIPP
jgi:hypothetical protein